jgi:hypothetical protein
VRRSEQIEFKVVDLTETYEGPRPEPELEYRSGGRRAGDRCPDEYRPRLLTAVRSWLALPRSLADIVFRRDLKWWPFLVMHVAVQSYHRVMAEASPAWSEVTDESVAVASVGNTDYQPCLRWT